MRAMADTNDTVLVPPEREPLAAEDAPSSVRPSPALVQPTPVTDVVPKKRSGVVVLAVLILLAAVIATAFVLVANRRISITDMRTLLELILGPLFTLAGAAVGFYFASR